MKALRNLTVVVGIAILVAAFALPAKADEFNKLTIFTFSQPIEIPGGKVLPAGTYSFKVLDTLGDRNVVQIFNKDQTKLFATFLTISDYRPQPSDKAIVKFSETTAGAPEAIKEWFYPGETYGWEFVYPKSRAVELAKASNQSVPSIPSNLSGNISEPAKTSSAPSVTALENASLNAEESGGKEVKVAEAFGTKPSTSATNDASTQKQTTVASNIDPTQPQTKAAATHKLPKTASVLPLVALAGVSLIATSGLLWAITKRRSVM